VRFWGMFRFTFSESIRKGTLIFYFAVATIFIGFFAFAFGLSAENPNVITIFGNPIPAPPTGNLDLVQHLLMQMHSSSVFWIILFGIFGVAGLVPSMLEKGTIDLFLSKPLHRAEMLMARALGATAGIAANLAYFFIGIWLVFGLKLGVWNWGFLSSALYVIFAFACLFSIVALVGLTTRSSGFSILLTIVYIFVSSLLEGREHFLFRLSDNAIYHRILDGLYYITPQLSAMLSNSSLLIGKNPFSPAVFTIMPYVYSLGSTALLYALASWYFMKRDY
jgi:ABC-type transport system involved in multi-copper enzyme maturation permease subunit